MVETSGLPADGDNETETARPKPNGGDPVIGEAASVVAQSALDQILDKLGPQEDLAARTKRLEDEARVARYYARAMKKLYGPRWGAHRAPETTRPTPKLNRPPIMHPEAAESVSERQLPVDEKPSPESMRQWLGKLTKRGRLLVPDVDLSESNLNSKIVRILNEDEINKLTDEKAAGGGLKLSETVIQPDGRIMFGGNYLPTNPYTTRILNELFFAYLSEPLDLRTLYARCGFADDCFDAKDMRAGLKNLHEMLINLKRLRIVAYNEKSQGSLSLFPAHITEKRQLVSGQELS